MANHPSAKKRARSSLKKKMVNKMNESKLKTLVKKTLTSSDKDEVQKLYKETVANLDRSTTKGKIHRNTAARRKSRLTKHLNKLTAK